jgi:hypothetical protein
MKPRTLLILLAVVLGLGAFIWFYERELPSSEERTELQKKVLEIEKDEVTAVTIASGKGQVRLERVEAPEPSKPKEGEDEEAPAAPVEWRITRPITSRADTFAVDQLLDAIASLEKTRTLEDFDRKEVGLDKPRVTVRLATKQGERVLRLGAEVPPGGSLVAGLEGETKAYVVGDTILSDLEKPPGDWRDRMMFRGDREDMQRITLTGAEGGPVVLVKRPAGFWIEKPLADRADQDLVDGMLTDLTGLTAERFVDEPKPPAELGLAPPRETVEVAFQDGAAPVRVELGASVSSEETPEGQASGELTYARVGNTVFEARTRLSESTRRPPTNWRALQLSALAVHDVESAVVREGGSSMQLARSGTDWKRGDTLISYLPVSDLLFAVTGARADRLLTPKEVPGLAKPSLTFTLSTKEMGEETLNLYPASAAGVPARANGRNVVLLLPADTFRDIQEKLRAVRSAKPAKPVE